MRAPENIGFSASISRVDGSRLDASSADAVRALIADMGADVISVNDPLANEPDLETGMHAAELARAVDLDAPLPAISIEMHTRLSALFRLVQNTGERDESFLGRAESFEATLPAQMEETGWSVNELHQHSGGIVVTERGEEPTPDYMVLGPAGVGPVRSVGLPKELTSDR